MNLEFSWQIFKKSSNIEFHLKNRPVGAELLHVDRQIDRQTERWTGRHDETNIRFSQFCEGTWQA